MKRKFFGKYQHSAWPQTPGRVTAARAMQRLGFHVDDCGLLVQNCGLDPLGHPKGKAPKYFSADYIEELAHDEHLLSHASDVVAGNHRKRNAGKGRSE